MPKITLPLFLCLCVVANSLAQNKPKAVAPAPAISADTSKSKKPAPLADKTKTSKKTEGLFNTYQDTVNGSVQLYIKKDQLDVEYIYQSFSLNGPTALYLNQSMHRTNFVFKMRKAFDKLEFSRVNTSFYYDPQSPISRTKEVDKPEAVFLVEKIAAEDSTGYLINADALFISEKMDPVKPPPGPSFFNTSTFGLGALNTSKSKYTAVKSFPANTDFIVDLAYDNPNPTAGGSDITDARYVRVRMQHSFIKMPENNFRPRRDDPRVGYFGQLVTDQTSISPTPYRDIINHWNLQKKDPSAGLSEPVEPIVYWIENTTPYQYRQIIKEAGLKWNAAFEKAGFKNAIAIKQMPDSADWDPSDLRYNVIRWVSSANPAYGAIGPSFVNPKTGQILGADIVIEWFAGSATPIFDELYNGNAAPVQLQPPGVDAHHLTNCTLGSQLKAQLLTGMTILDVTDADTKEIGEMHKQFLTYLVMHEIGHTLGLNHNMKSSQFLSLSDINNKELTRKYGLTGSVMDYPAINIAIDRKKQGDYYTTLAGPYDLWAIEYGYTPFSESEEESSLKKILSRSTDPKLAFGNDGDDMRSPGKAMDPRVNVSDLTSDAVGYAEERFQLVNSLMSKLLKKYSKEGQSYAELRSRYTALQAQRLNMISVVSRYIGGVYVDRSFPEQKSTSKPFTPVPLALQKRAVSVLNKYVFAPDAYIADGTVYAYLQPQRRLFNQSSAGDDYRITNIVLNNQIIGAIAHILHPSTLLRITNSRLYGNQYSVAEVLTDLTSGIFDADLKTNVNVHRQYLQTTYVKGLLSITDPKSSQFDDVAKAAALYNVRKIKAKLASAVLGNEETKAHRASIVYIINNALEAK